MAKKREESLRPQAVAVSVMYVEPGQQQKNDAIHTSVELIFCFYSYIGKLSESLCCKLLRIFITQIHT